MAAAWTGVGVSYPSSATMRTRSADRPSESKVKAFAPVWSRRGHRRERDGGPVSVRRWTRAVTGRPEHSGNGYDRAVTAARDPRRSRSSRGPGSPTRVHAYEAPEPHGRARDERPSYGLDAAAALGVAPGAGVQDARRERSTGGLVLAVVPVDRRTRPQAAGRCRAPAVGRSWPTRPRRSERPATSSAGSARWVRAGRCRSWSTSAPGARDGLRVGRTARSPARARPARSGAPEQRAFGPDREGPWSGMTRIAPGWHTDARSQASTVDRLNRRTPPPTAEPCHRSGVPPGHPDRSHRSNPRLRRVSDAPSDDDLDGRRSLCRRRHHPPSSRATTRCSGGEEARILPVPEHGAQRASSNRSVRLAVLALAFALVAAVGIAANPTPAAAAGMKVVVVVGPVESSTAKYISNAKRYAAQARSLRGHRRRDLQPERDLGQGQGGRPGRERPHLPRPRQRLAQPVRRLRPGTRRTGWGSTRRPATATATRSITASTTSRPQVKLAPNAVVILNHLCYASGNSEWGRANPTKTSRSSASTTSGRASCAPGAKAVFAEGITDASYILYGLFTDEPDDRRDLPELAELERQVRLPVPVQAERPVPGLDGLRSRPAGTTGRSSATSA